MNARTKARILAAVVFAVLLGLVARQFERNSGAMGKEAYVASQAARFDKFYAKLHPISHHLAVGALIAGVALGAYELLALGIYAVIKPRRESGAA